MRKAYIILAHKNPAQLIRLIQALDDGLSTFYVHIDKSKPIVDFASVSHGRSDIIWVKREDSQWGRIGIVLAILNALKSINDRIQEFDRIILLSGQDYPTKTNSEINQFLRNSRFRIFMNFWEIPNFEKWEHRGGLSRIDKYFFGFSMRMLAAAKVLNFFGRILPPFRRKMPYQMKPYGGWMWWILDDKAVRLIVDFISEHPKYIKYHRHTFAPDEIFFQSILLNAADDTLLLTICNDDKRYVLWKADQSHPEILNSDTVKTALSSEDLFARKFDSDMYPNALDLIDTRLRLREQLTD